MLRVLSRPNLVRSMQLRRAVDLRIFATECNDGAANYRIDQHGTSGVVSEPACGDRQLVAGYFSAAIPQRGTRILVFCATTADRLQQTPPTFHWICILWNCSSVTDISPSWPNGSVPWGARGCIALVAGEAGIGKTVLLQEFSKRQRDVRVLWGACDALYTPRPSPHCMTSCGRFGCVAGGHQFRRQPRRDLRCHAR